MDSFEMFARLMVVFAVVLYGLIVFEDIAALRRYRHYKHKMLKRIDVVRDIVIILLAACTASGNLLAIFLGVIVLTCTVILKRHYIDTVISPYPREIS